MVKDKWFNQGYFLTMAHKLLTIDVIEKSDSNLSYFVFFKFDFF